ncbi:MAG: bifunctional phosphoribosylaminoimidazolecarboxamide formyltransferase/IMP cyclohydrolase [Chloroflexi bacterium]|nr:bifunctional phosphoribosylaminoimidazolecarboxamide formyltransferase/IMP cyclohydrolase [Chloroflexota bacterium]MCY3938478.1 bifunctional phosphoribosylaminoimidazolecarboxamide formyltransferase/IMP cyclohydrolase [Chloroflexota bacterium]
MSQKRALLSVYDKTGIVDFARWLVDLGFEIISTGGTHASLDNAGIPVRQVSEVTSSPEILDGRVKTLHPTIHGGLLARRGSPDDMQTIDGMDIPPIDVVAVNLYPFASTLSQRASHAEIIEQIDIGGPAMIRSAAKNSESVFVVVDPDDYPAVLEAIESGRGADLRDTLAAKAFSHTAVYDAVIAAYLSGRGAGPTPAELAVPMTRIGNLSYGENPHQTDAAFYAFGSKGLDRSGLAATEQLHGPALSYNNVLDAAAAWDVVSDFDQPAVAVIKHGNPCGLAAGTHPLAELFRRAREGDPISIFGGIVATNRPLDYPMTAAMRSIRLDVIVAPDFAPDALKRLRRRKSTRILKVPSPSQSASGRPLPLSGRQVRSVPGGFLLQEKDSLPPDDLEISVVSKRQPTDEQLAQLRFAWRAVKHVKSNAIVLVKDGSLVGVGAGQMSRVDSVFMAVRRAGDRAAGSVLASDAFFPFDDGPEIALRAGVEAIIEPGGSKGDQSVIDMVDRHDAVLVFTGGERHFRH